MTLQQWAAFTAVCQSGSYTAAASELHLSQSALSKQIMSLENELGVELFIRSTRALRLSDVGSQILPHAQKLVRGYNGMLHCAAQSRQNGAALIRLGGIPVLGVYGITAAILQFESLFPDVNTEIWETQTSDILYRLTAHQLDVGIVRLALPMEQDSHTLTVIPLIDDQQVLIVPPGHPMADRACAALTEVDGETFILRNTDPMMSAYHIQYLRSQLPAAPLQLTNMKMDSIKQCVVKKGWLTLVMEQVAREIFLPQTRSVPLKDPLKLTLCAVLRKESTDTGCKALVEFLISYFAGQTAFPLPVERI